MLATFEQTLCQSKYSNSTKIKGMVSLFQPVIGLSLAYVRQLQVRHVLVHSTLVSVCAFV